MAESILEILIKAKSDANKVLGGISKEAKKAKASLEEINEIDAATLQAAMDEAAQALEGLGLSADSVNARLREMGFDTAKREADQLIKTLEGVKKQFDELIGIGGRLAASGIAPVLFGRKIVADAAEFSKTLTQISLVSGGTAGSVSELSSTIQDLSENFGNAKEEVAAAFFAAITSGARDAAEATDVLTVSDRLADAAGGSLLQTNQALIDVLKAFGLGMKDAASVADSLFVAVQGGAGTLDQIGAAMRLIGPLANAMGIEFRDVSTVIQALGRAGVSGTRAMAGLRGTLEALSKPNEELSRAFAAAGEASVEQTLKTKGLVETLKILLRITGGNRKELERLVGGTQIANTLAVLGANNFEQLAVAMEKQANAAGAAARAGDEAQKSLGERLSTPVAQLTNAFVDLGNAVGEIILPLVEAAGRVAKSISEWVKENQRLAGTITAIVVVGGALMVALGGILALVGAVGGAITQGIIIFTKLGGVMGLLTKLAAPLTFAIKGIIAALTLLARHPIIAALIFTTTQIYRLISAINSWRQATAALEAQQNRLQTTIDKLDSAGARNIAIKSTEELIALTDEEIKAYEESILQRLRLNAAEKVLAATRRDTSAVEQLQKLEDDLLKAIQASSKELERRSALVSGQVADVDSIGNAYKRSTKDVQAFVDSLNQVNEISTANLLDSLDQVQKQFKSIASLQEIRLFGTAIRALVTDTDALVDAEKKFATERLRILSNSSRKAIFIAQVEFTQKKALIDRSEESDAVKEELTLQLARDFSARRIAVLTQELAQVKTMRDQAFQAFAQSKQKEVDLERQIRNTKLQFENDIRDLRRRGMSEFEALEDKREEIEELASKTRKALLAGDFELARSFADRRLQLAKDIADQDPSEDNIEKVEEAQRGVLTVMEAQRAEAKKLAEEQKAIFESLAKSVEKLASVLATEAGQKLDIEARIEDTGAKSAIESLVRPTDSEHTVVPITNAIDEAIQRIQQPTSSTHTVNVVQSGGQPQGLASGGHVRGPGTGTSDSILAMLSNGEYVIKAAAVKFFGRGFMDAVNGMRLSKRRMAGFSAGGPVASFSRTRSRIPAFAGGGPVSGGGSLGNLTFTFGPGRTATVMTSSEDAAKLAKEFGNLSRHGVGVRRI